MSHLLVAFGLSLSVAHVLVMGVVVGWRDRAAWALVTCQNGMVWIVMVALAAGESLWLAVLLLATAVLSPLAWSGWRT